MTTHECNFVEEKEPDGRLILGPCIECDMPAAEAIKELSTTKELLKETQDNRNDAWEQVAQLQARVEEYKNVAEKLDNLHQQYRDKAEAYEKVLEDVINTEWPVSVNIKDVCRATLRTHKGESNDPKN